MHLLDLEAFLNISRTGYLEFTPVDTASTAIKEIILHPNINNRIFHLFNHNHISIEVASKYFKLLNKDFIMLDDTTFKNKLKNLLNNSDKNDFVKFLINDIDKDLHLSYKTDIIIKSDFTINYLDKLGFHWPKIDKKYLNNFINLLKGVF